MSPALPEITNTIFLQTELRNAPYHSPFHKPQINANPSVPKIMRILRQRRTSAHFAGNITIITKCVPEALLQQSQVSFKTELRKNQGWTTLEINDNQNTITQTVLGTP
jgi:hypothetical protein